MIVVFWFILPEKISNSGPSEASAVSEWMPFVTPASVSTRKAGHIYSVHRESAVGRWT